MSDERITPGQCRAARAYLGWKQAQVADEAKVSRVSVANFELGKSRMYRKNIDAIRGAFERHGVSFTTNVWGSSTSYDKDMLR